MSVLIETEQQIEKKLNHIHELLSTGQFIEAMETYLHDEVILREANDEPKVGKQFNVQFEQDFIDNQLAKFVRYDARDIAISGDRSYYSAVMELDLKDGSTMVSEQVVATQWKDGKIYRERYFHA